MRGVCDALEVRCREFVALSNIVGVVGAVIFWYFGIGCRGCWVASEAVAQVHIFSPCLMFVGWLLVVLNFGWVSGYMC